MNNENKKGRPKQKENNTFRERFLLLVGDATHAEIAAKIGTSRQNVGNWLSGGTNTKPDIYTLVNIAKAYNVSTDYLLGLNDEKSPDVNVQSMHRYSGLSERSIELLGIFRKHEAKIVKMISQLLCDNTFYEMIRSILALETESKNLRGRWICFIEKGRAAKLTTESLDVYRYSVHKFMEKILDEFDFRKESDYKQLEEKVIDNIDFSLLDPKK